MRDTLHTLASAAALLAVVAAGCSLLGAAAEDGESCSGNDDCKSKDCRAGTCAGSDCSRDSCRDGWTCVHYDPDFISDFFGADGSDRCEPMCGACPAGTYCPEGGTPGEVQCVWGTPPPEVMLPTGLRATVGRPLTLRAEVSSGGGAITKYEWSFRDGTPTETTTTPEVSHVFAVGYATKHPVSVSVTDAAGKTGQAETSIEFECVPAGEACSPMFCCGESTSCLAEGGGTVCRAPRPGTVTLTGPSVSLPREDARFVAEAMTEGEVREFVWVWGDGDSDTDSFVDSNISEREHYYWDPGKYTVSVRARDSFDFQVTATHVVSVCAEAGSRCSPAVDCCPGLICTTRPDGLVEECE